MKKIVILLILVAYTLGFIGFASAEECLLDIDLLNQDPYPAVQGEYVKLVLKVDGLVNSECGDVYIELEEKYPIKFDSGVEKSKILNSGVYVSGYENYALIPFKVKIDEDALDEEYELSVRYVLDYSALNNVYYTDELNLTVRESNTYFEISVKDYDYEKELLTLEIINVGKNDVEALSIDVNSQENFLPKGSTRDIIGSLDSNDDTTFTFNGMPKTGNIDFTISFNDEQNKRRSINAQAHFEENLFVHKLIELQKPNYTLYYVIAAGIIILGFWIRAIIKKRKRVEQMKLKRV